MTITKQGLRNARRRLASAERFTDFEKRYGSEKAYGEKLENEQIQREKFQMRKDILLRKDVLKAMAKETKKFPLYMRLAKFIYDTNDKLLKKNKNEINFKIDFSDLPLENQQILLELSKSIIKYLEKEGVKR